MSTDKDFEEMLKMVMDAEDDLHGVPHGTMLKKYEEMAPAIQEIRDRKGLLSLHFSLTPQSTPENLEETIDYLDERRKIYDEIPEVVKLQYQIEQLKARIQQFADLQKTGPEIWKRIGRMKEIKPYYDLWMKLNAIDTDFLDVIHLDGTIEFYEKIKEEVKII